MSEIEDPNQPKEGQEINSRETIEAPNDGSDIEDGYPDPRKRRLHPAIIAAVVTGVVGVLFLAIWYLRSSSGGAGLPVPAPRSTSMADVPAGAVLDNPTVTITQEQLASSGIVIDTVGEQLAEEVGLSAATGVIEANAYRQTPALSLVDGIVKQVYPELGSNVAKGETVAIVFSSELAEAQSRYVALLTEAENARRNYQRTQRLVAVNQPGRTEADQAARQVKAAEASLSEMQNRFQRTVKLLKIGAASREELEQDTTKLRTAEAEVTEARRRQDRALTLLDINPQTKAENEEALNKLRTAESDVALMRQKLILYGITEGRISALRNASQVSSLLAVPAPVSGTVTGRTANAGEVIEANKEIVRITDLSVLWVIAQVYERDISRLRVGSGASVTSNAFPNRLFRGRVTYIDPAINEATRTAMVRVELENPDRILKLGMYVNIAFGSLGQSERTVAVIPPAALQTVNNRQVVFRATADPTVFEMQPVRVGPEINGRYPVIEGLNVGDRIVTQGSFMLRAEWQKTQQSSQGHESHGS